MNPADTRYGSSEPLALCSSLLLQEEGRYNAIIYIL
jgi:hypothetical protein